MLPCVHPLCQIAIAIAQNDLVVYIVEVDPRDFTFGGVEHVGGFRLLIPQLLAAGQGLKTVENHTAMQ
jgi:hypothetical protein